MIELPPEQPGIPGDHDKNLNEQHLENDSFDHKVETRRFIEELESTSIKPIDDEILKYAKAHSIGESDWDRTKCKLSGLVDLKRDTHSKPNKSWKKTPKHRRENRYKRRADKFRKVQKCFNKEKSLTVKQLIDNTFDFEDKPLIQPEIAEIEKVYVDRLENSNKSDTARIVKGITVNDEVTFGVITDHEIISVIKDTKKDTGAGVDGWGLNTIKLIGTTNVKVIFNSWWAFGIPNGEKLARTTLIPKTGDLTQVGNWRPITIGTILLRLYCKIWDRRMRKKFKINERQKAFVPVDGCYENVKILQNILQNSRKSKKEVNVVFLDLSKAFDTVQHDTIIKALLRKGVPNDVRNLVSDLYSNTFTTISVNGQKTRTIQINSGVKQGCPLSPLLFNFVIDELIDEIQQLDSGYKLQGQQVSIMGFADDLVLISDNDYGMKHLLQRCETFFDNRGLSVNTKKSLSLRTLPIRGKNSMKTISETHRFFKGSPLPSADYDQMMRYLGVQLNPLGEVYIPLDLWTTWFERLRRAPLKPAQKIWSIRSVLVPRMLHQLRLADSSIWKLKIINKLIRKNFKLILHLPEWTPDSWIYLRGGGNLGDITTMILKSRKKASAKMATSDDRVASIVGTELDLINNENLQRLGFVPETIKREFQDQQARKLAMITTWHCPIDPWLNHMSNVIGCGTPPHSRVMTW